MKVAIAIITIADKGMTTMIGLIITIIKNWTKTC